MCCFHLACFRTIKKLSPSCESLWPERILNTRLVLYCFFFLPVFLLVVCGLHGDEKAALSCSPCLLPPLSIVNPFFSIPSLPFPSLLRLSARCVSSATFQPTSHLHCRRRVGDGDQRRAKRQPANVQAGSGGGWWRWKERPHHPIFPEDLCARLRPHHRGLVPQTHRDRRAVGDTGW